MKKHAYPEINALIIRGQWEAALFRCLEVAHQKRERSVTAELASYFRRLSRPDLAVKLLFSLVRSDSRQKANPTVQELEEYGAALVRLGLNHEALGILTTAKNRGSQKANLYLAFNLIGQWDFQSALPLLHSFIEERSTTAYDRMTAQVNLALGSVFLERFEEARKLLDYLQQETKKTQSMLLLANTLEIAAELEIRMKNWGEAEQLLSQSRSALQAGETIDHLLIEKQAALLHLHRSNGSSLSIQKISEIKLRSQRNHRYEIVRECDFHLALVTGNHEIAQKIYWGTPYASYRQMVKENLRSLDTQNSSQITLQYGPSPIEIDLESGIFKNSDSLMRLTVKAGSALHRLLIGLVSDFYKPLSVTELSNVIYPGEHFNPHSTPTKVHQLMHRFRTQLRKARLPIAIEETRGRYQLQTKTGLRLTPLLAKETLNSEALYLTHLLKRSQEVGMSEFRPSEFGKVLNIPIRSARRHLCRSADLGLVTRVPNGPQTKYIYIRSNGGS